MQCIWVTSLWVYIYIIDLIICGNIYKFLCKIIQTKEQEGVTSWGVPTVAMM